MHEYFEGTKTMQLRRGCIINEKSSKVQLTINIIDDSILSSDTADNNNLSPGSCTRAMQMYSYEQSGKSSQVRKAPDRLTLYTIIFYL